LNRTYVAFWLDTLISINIIALRRTNLVLGQVTTWDGGWVNYLEM